ncbi:hypothetical protein NM688_g5355 [Phlebia brevispora]|uniref:Uncharacterized protein n=1 Tax=Phlebia brevispora TaxID=194682 RepID=A0ACC1SWH8_9APHY|nr:hypothetical protein NM688_g5355 [Phlebia brevispora]
MDTATTPNIPAILKAAGVDMASTFGVVYLGVAISSIIYGIACCQAINYYASPKARTDSWLLKAIVPFLCCLETAHQALVIHLCYYYLILEYGNPLALDVLIWSLPAQIFLGIALSFIVQSLPAIYAEPQFVASNILRTFASGQYRRIPVLPRKTVSVAEDRLQSKSVAGLGASVSADLAIALAMSYCLYRSRTGYRKSDSLIARLILLSVTTGLLAGLVELIGYLLLLVKKHTLYDLFFGCIGSKLAANTLLFILNTRDRIGGTRTSVMMLTPLPPSSATTKGEPTGRLGSVEDESTVSVTTSKVWNYLPTSALVITIRPRKRPSDLIVKKTARIVAVYEWCCQQYIRIPAIRLTMIDRCGGRGFAQKESGEKVREYLQIEFSVLSQACSEPGSSDAQRSAVSSIMNHIEKCRRRESHQSAIAAMRRCPSSQELTAVGNWEITRLRKG